MADEASQANAPARRLQSSKGQPSTVKFFTTRNLSVIVAGAVLMVAILKADTKDIPKIVEIVVSSKHSAALGWSIALVVLVGAIILNRIMGRIYDKEIERLVEERDRLQKHLLGLQK